MPDISVVFATWSHYLATAAVMVVAEAVYTSFGFGAGLPRFLLDIGVAPARLHLVHPKEKEIDGLPVYPTVKEVPVDVDLAIVIVPAPVVPGVLGRCVEKGIKVINVQSAGFAETGPDGARMQEEMGRLAKESGTRILGPNCVGVVNVPGRFSTCEVDLDAIRPGGISVVAQSGVFGNSYSYCHIAAQYDSGNKLFPARTFLLGYR